MKLILGCLGLFTLVATAIALPQTSRWKAHAIVLSGPLLVMAFMAGYELLRPKGILLGLLEAALFLIIGSAAVVYAVSSTLLVALLGRTPKLAIAIDLLVLAFGVGWWVRSLPPEVSPEAGVAAARLLAEEREARRSQRTLTATLVAENEAREGGAIGTVQITDTELESPALGDLRQALATPGTPVQRLVRRQLDRSIPPRTRFVQFLLLGNGKFRVQYREQLFEVSIDRPL